MDMADEAVPFHELLVGGRSVSGVRPDAARRVGLVRESIAQTVALIGSGVRRALRQAWSVLISPEASQAPCPKHRKTASNISSAKSFIAAEGF